MEIGWVVDLAAGGGGEGSDAMIWLDLQPKRFRAWIPHDLELIRFFTIIWQRRAHRGHRDVCAAKDDHER